MNPPSLRLAPSVTDSSVFEVQEQGSSDSRRLRPSLLIQLCKRRSFIHAWLSSLRKTDGLKFPSLFWLFFLFLFGHWGAQSASAIHTHCSFNVKKPKKQRSDERQATFFYILHRLWDWTSHRFSVFSRSLFYPHSVCHGCPPLCQFHEISRACVSH